MTLLIHDANVLIDLIDIDLLDLALDLPYGMTMTDLVYGEIEDPKQSHVLATCITKKRIRVITSTTKEMDVIIASMKSSSSLSLADCSVLYHADILDGIVITGDRKVRKEAGSRNIKVHGTPWILMQLVEAKRLCPLDAITKMDLLLAVNPRLPREKCEDLKKMWRLQITLGDH